MNIEAAILLGEEDNLGALDLGHYADFAIFNGDPFKEGAKVVMTILGGEIVYDAEEDLDSNWYIEYQKTHQGQEVLGEFQEEDDYEEEE